MTKIDIEKFIVSMIQQLKDGHPLRVNILYALLNQGLIYTGDSIVRAVNKKEGPSLEEAITNEPVVKRKSNPSSTMPFEWSEEDETISNAIIKKLIGSDALSVDLQSAICWVSNVKDRVQPKQEWSKEDEAFYQRLEQIVCKVDIEAFQGDRDLHSWLKHLVPQNRWKPSKEQMEALKDLCCYSKSTGKGALLCNLYHDLIKL